MSTKGRWRDRFFRRYAAWIAAHPKAIVWTCLLSVVIALPIAISRFKITADQDALLDEQVEYHRRYLDYLKDFGDQEYVYVVLENTAPVPDDTPADSVDLSHLKHLADTIGTVLRAQPERFQQVLWKVDPQIFLENALLFLSEEQVDEIASSLAELDPILEQLAPDPGPAAILETMARELKRLSDEGDAENPDEERGERLFSFLKQYLAELRRAAEGDPAPSTALASLFPRSELDDTEDDREGYFVSETKRLLFLLILPVKDYAGDMAVISEPLAEIRRLQAEIKEGYAWMPMDIGVTGRPVLQADEMDTTDKDTALAGILSFLGVALITFIIFGNFGRPLLMLLSLAVGLSWSFLAATLVVEALNLLSMVFAAVLVGLGIDFAVHIVVRYQEGLTDTKDPVEALRRSLTTSAIGNVTGAVSSALGFYGTLLTNFSGLAELGLIAGTGVLLCLVSSLVFLPALLLLYDSGKKGIRPVKPLRGLPFAIGRPGLLLAIAALVSVVVYIPVEDPLYYDNNILNLQAEGLDSVKWEHKVLEHSSRSSWFSVCYTRTLQEAAAVAEKLRALETVGKVESPSDFVPEGQPAKIDKVRALFQPYTPLPQLEVPGPVARDDLEGAAELLLEELELLDTLLLDLPDGEQKEEARAAVGELLDAVEALWEGAATADVEALNAHARSFRDHLSEQLSLLGNSAHPTGLSLEKLPPPLDTRFRGQISGKYGVIVYPSIDVWEPDSLAIHVGEVRTIDQNMVGVTVQIHESTGLIAEAFQTAFGYALLAVALLLWVDLKSPFKALLALVPLAVGIFWLLCAMHYLELSFNLANFFAVPILVGIGVDGGVHLIHRFGEKGEVDLTGSSTGTSVLAAALTTVFGFGSLTTASHRGLSSLGALLGIGAFTCLLAALFVLPALLHLFYVSLPRLLRRRASAGSEE